MRIKGQQQRWSFFDQTDARMLMSVNTTCVPFGLFEPAFECQVVLGQVGGVATDEEATFKTGHHTP